MKDHPIMFSAPMVLALLAGRKTITRRLAWRDCCDCEAESSAHFHKSIWQNVQRGDRLWVRENFWQYGRWNASKRSAKTAYSFEPLREPSDLPNIIYAADASESSDTAGRTAPPEHGKFGDPVPGWHLRPNIFLKREDSRISMTVTATKIEPLQSITTYDAMAEGVERDDSRTLWGVRTTGGNFWHLVERPVPAFMWLWRKLHGDESWDRNPEVVAMTFAVHFCNIDKLKETA